MRRPAMISGLVLPLGLLVFVQSAGASDLEELLKNPCGIVRCGGKREVVFLDDNTVYSVEDGKAILHTRDCWGCPWEETVCSDSDAGFRACQDKLKEGNDDTDTDDTDTDDTDTDPKTDPDAAPDPAPAPEPGGKKGKKGKKPEGVEFSEADQRVIKKAVAAFRRTGG